MLKTLSMSFDYPNLIVQRYNLFPKWEINLKNNAKKALNNRQPAFKRQGHRIAVS